MHVPEGIIVISQHLSFSDTKNVSKRSSSSMEFKINSRIIIIAKFRVMSMVIFHNITTFYHAIMCHSPWSICDVFGLCVQYVLGFVLAMET